MQYQKKPFVQSGRDLARPSAWKYQKGILGSVTFSGSQRFIKANIDDVIPKALEFSLRDLKQDRRRPFSFIAVSGYYGALWEISFLVRIPQKISAEMLESSLNRFFSQYRETVNLREVEAPSLIAEVMRTSSQLADGWHTEKPLPNVRDSWDAVLRPDGGWIDQ